MKDAKVRELIGDENESVPERLKNTRIQLGYKQNFVADCLNVNKSTLSIYESQRIPDGETLVRMADFYGTTTDYLLCRTHSSTAILNIERVEDNSLSKEDKEWLFLLNHLSEDNKKFLKIILRQAMDIS